MSYLSSVKVPAGAKKTAVKGGYLATVQKPTAAQSKRAVQIQQLTTQARIANDNYKKTSSLGGILANTFTLGGTLTPHNLFGGAKEVFNDVKGSLTPLAPSSYNFSVAAKTNPLEVPKDFGHTFAQAIQDAGDKLSLAYDGNNYSSFSKGTATLGNAGLGIISGLFAPITATLKASEKIPVIGVAAGAVNNLFAVIGAGGGALGEGVIDSLPISDDAKENLRPFAHDAGALVAQIAAGKASPKAVPILKEKTTQILDIIKNDAKKTATKPIASAPVAPNAAPIAPAGAVAPKNPFLASVTVPERVAPVAPEASVGAKIAPNTRALKLEQAVVERKLADTLGEVPGHEVLNMAEQARQAIDFIEKNPKAAERIAVGESISPPELRPEAVYTALEAKAIREMDIDTIMRLKDSKVPTLAGQALKSLDSIDPDSPVQILRSIEKEREASVKEVSRQRSTEVKSIKDHIEKAGSKRQGWDDFIKEIQCGY